MLPGLVVDRKACGFVLFRRKRREKRSCGLQEGRKRDAGSFGREKLRHDVTPLGDTSEGLGKGRMGAIEHGLEPWRHIKRSDRRRGLSISQVEVRRLSCHLWPPHGIGVMYLAGQL
jgi:hypothetical protein